MEKKETTEAGTVSISQDRRYDLKLRALIMLYEERLTQTEIARQLNISRVTLGKLLEEAKKEGMIRFEIVDVRGKRKIVQLEKRMRQTFGLRDVRLVDCPNADDPLRARRIAEEAASYVGGKSEERHEDRPHLGTYAERDDAFSYAGSGDPKSAGLYACRRRFHES